MASVTFDSITLSDRNVVEAFAKIAADARITSPLNIIAYPVPRLAGFSQSLPDVLSSPTEEFAILFENHAAVAHKLTMEVPAPFGGTIEVTREAAKSVTNVSLNDKCPSGPAAALLSAIKRHLRAADMGGGLHQVLGREMADFYQRREAELVRLESLNQRLTEGMEEYRVKLEAQFANKTEALERSIGEKSKALEGEYIHKERELAEKASALDERARQLDDRDAKHVRRQIRSDLKKIFAERSETFALTKTTNRKRWVIHILFIVLVALTMLYVYDAVLQVHAALTSGALGGILYIELARSTIGAIAVAAAVVFYIRWNDAWFKRHAEEEFNLKRLELDIDRASWVAEMVLEWQEDKGGPVSSELINRLTANLFSPNRDDASVRHPSEDAITSLLRAAQRFRLTIPGVGEFDLDRASVRRLAKAANASDASE